MNSKQIEILLNCINIYLKKMCKSKIDIIKTKNGKTQYTEDVYSVIFENILNVLNIDYRKNSSQKFIDFMIYFNNTEIPIELKKTSRNRIILNDTFPSSNVVYFIIYVGKEPKIFWKYGMELLIILPDDLLQFREYFQEFQNIKNKIKSKLFGNLNVYPRPNFSIDIKHHLKNEKVLLIN